MVISENKSDEAITLPALNAFIPHNPTASHTVSIEEEHRADHLLK